jgi:hypothetical protein
MSAAAPRETAGLRCGLGFRAQLRGGAFDGRGGGGREERREEERAASHLSGRLFDPSSPSHFLLFASALTVFLDP